MRERTPSEKTQPAPRFAQQLAVLDDRLVGRAEMLAAAERALRANRGMNKHRAYPDGMPDR
jgi:hypothetical protein